MTNSWTGAVAASTGPKYLRIVRAIAEGIRSGGLAPGDQLPPQRDLADELDVTVGTVARAYQTAADEGLVQSHVGRGTFVLGVSSDHEKRIATVDLTMNRPVDRPIRDRVLDDIRTRTRDRDARDLLLYGHGESGSDAEAAASWLSRSGRAVGSRDVVVVAGGQHGLFLSLLALCRPGDTVLTESFVYPGIRAAADAIGVRLAGVRGDDEGIDVDHLQHCIRQTKATVACFTPVLANPLASSWSSSRLDAVAQTASETGLRVIEDDVYRSLHDAPPASLHSRNPGGVLVSSISKALTAGLRTGAVTADGPLLRRLRELTSASVLMVSPLLTATASSLMTAPDLDDLLARHRERIAQRHALAREVLPGDWIRSPARGLHLWLAAPHAWGGRAFVEALRRAGLLVTHGSVFAVPPETGEDALRVSIGGHLAEDAFRAALERLMSVARVPPQSSGPVV